MHNKLTIYKTIDAVTMTNGVGAAYRSVESPIV